MSSGLPERIPLPARRSVKRRSLRSGNDPNEVGVPARVVQLFSPEGLLLFSQRTTLFFGLAFLLLGPFPLSLGLGHRSRSRHIEVLSLLSR